MIKRTIEISQGPAHLALRDDQLVIKRRGDCLATVPCEDIGVLVIDERATTYTHGLLARLLEFGAVVVICGRDHHPAGLLLPVAANTLQTERLRTQIEAKRPLCKRLWQQIVRCKIRHQAANLGPEHPVSRKLYALLAEVRSGDPTNVEAQAGRLYWPAMFNDTDFRRRPDGAPPNNLLNYGYAVMRAAVARAICAAGLHPSIGLQHRNRYNAFCLADDLLEPFRPMVDRRVRALHAEGEAAVTRRAKAELLAILAEPITLAGQTGPLMVGLHRMLASLCRCYQGQQKHLDLPEP